MDGQNTRKISEFQARLMAMEANKALGNTIDRKKRVELDTLVQMWKTMGFVEKDLDETMGGYYHG